MTRTGLIFLLIFAAPLSAADKTKTIDSFSLSDARTGKPVALTDFAQSKAIVVVFLGTACTISNCQLIELAQLHKQYSGKGVQFLGINSNQQDKIADVARHAKDNEIPFPVLKDVGAKVAEKFRCNVRPKHSCSMKNEWFVIPVESMTNSESITRNFGLPPENWEMRSMPFSAEKPLSFCKPLRQVAKSPGR